MGLDMNAFAVESGAIPDGVVVDFAIAEGVALEELHYWRKHHDLHGFFHNLYDLKGGTSSDFNCDNVQITAEDLDKLEESLKGKSLPQTSGFFFGNNPPDSESNKEDLEFVAAARQAIADGKKVFYTSWW